ncbi:carboxypeptidase-like regulatory domain-containing protein [Flavobacterium sp. GP15]|uniref:carboxypeptidase-like regulatory domain-containing protein n=1 Tax=Flavobacterium sp. GP15 TaxID=2758567 RepID=UPI00165E0D11|nr:carboxypeptidase-like regulatory domain-containing protein [Flavobacterium sp. GP15]
MKIINILLLLCIGITNAQNNKLEEVTNNAKILFSKLQEKEKNPLYIVNGITIEDYAVISSIKPEDIEGIVVLKKQSEIEKYGQKGENGIVEITLKYSDNKKLEQLIKKNSVIKFEKNNYKIIISGLISDKDANPLATVVISNLTKKEAYHSDSNGNYLIRASNEDVLNFTLRGYESQQIIVNNQTIQNVVLKKVNTNSEIMIKKPVVYLYPTAKTDITFSFNFNGILSTTFPKYESNWQLTAYPDGKIFDKKTNRFYSSLFWDGKQTFSEEHYKYKTGFTVSKKDLTNFLIEKLEILGLNTYETNDFVQYWLPILEKNETNFVHFYSNSDYDVFSTNAVNPKPETSIRVFMEFYAVENKTEIPEQKLVKTQRKGFTLVEWGGADVTQAVQNLNYKSNAKPSSK